MYLSPSTTEAVSVVTGSSKVDGIGAATAIALAHEGANVRLIQ